MPNPQLPFFRRIIFWLLLPVIVVGIAVSGGVITYLSQPMIDHLTLYFETNLKLASKLGLGICEGNFTSLLNMRLEDNAEMNQSMQNQALEEIKALSRQMPPIQMIVLKGKQSILAASIEVSTVVLGKSSTEWDDESVNEITVEHKLARGHLRYFPFWDWTIISFVFETDYQAPIKTAKSIVYFGTISVFVAVLITLLIVFQRLVNTPLKRLVRATESVIAGKLLKVEQIEHNELGRLIASFNNMVESLDREKAEVRHLLDELKSSEGRFRTLFENTPIGICVVRIDGSILETNESLQRMIGYSKGEMKLQALGNLFFNKENGRLMLTRLQNGPVVDVFETTLKRKNESACQARITATTTELENTKTLIVMMEDITNQKKLEGQLQRAQKMEAIGTLAGGVAHDLNNVLSGLVSYPELLLLKLPADSPLRKSVLTIQKSGQKAATIVQDLLTLARRGVATKETLNLNDLVREYLVSPEYEKLMRDFPHVVVETDLNANLANTSGSFVHLTKALMNLVSNAAEAIQTQGTIRVTTENRLVEKTIKGYEYIEDGLYTVLTVSDTGIGLSPDDQEKIFEPFYTRKKMGRSGTGLGLTIVWGTVKDHDGYINIKSELGKGTEFTLYFPASEAELAPVKDRLLAAEYQSRGETILIVDDIKEQRDLLQEMLTVLNYKVISAASGEDAVALLNTQSADLVILDMIMEPGIDGLETYRRIQAIRPRQKAIIASGYSETDRVKEAERLGVGCYLKKPFTMEEIGVAVRKELDR